MITDTGIPVSTATIATRAAAEGVPVAAIARIVQVPFDLVAAHLKVALGRGDITEVPKADWPPGQGAGERARTVTGSAQPDDIEFYVRKAFKLTKLETAFMQVLLRHELTIKEKLHGVIEEQRSKRHTRASLEETDPKMVDVIICKLRKKLRDVDPTFVLNTCWSTGYFFEADTKAAILKFIMPEVTAS